MTVGIGVIGTGMIGADHIERLSTTVPHATVTGVFDIDEARVASIAKQLGATAHGSADALIAATDVDAIVIASPGPLHAEQTLAGIAAEKPVLCEKPLAPTSAECHKVLDAEVALDRRLVQVGFMRRYDPGYLQVKAAIDAGDVGELLMAHMWHRNPDVPPTFTTEMVMNDALIHEMDTTRWLFGEEVVAVRVLIGKASPNAPTALVDPSTLVLETASGSLVQATAFVTCGFGYDVRCEVVGSDGTVALETPRLTTRTTLHARSERVPELWRERFGESYRLELAAWVADVRAGTATGPSAWDGYAATAIAEASVASLRSGDRVAVDLIDQPALYRR